MRYEMSGKKCSKVSKFINSISVFSVYAVAKNVIDDEPWTTLCTTQNGERETQNGLYPSGDGQTL